MRKHKRRMVSDEEHSLWQKVIQDAVPLAKPAKIKVKTKKSDKSRKSSEALHSFVAAPIRPFSLGERAAPKKNAVTLTPSLDEQFQMVSPNMDRRNFHRLKKGKKAIDGTLDLHGMTAVQAHHALNNYVLKAHAADWRLLLVITGKGKTSKQNSGFSDRTGVLKHSLPQWLKMMPLAPLVLQVTQAHGKHGGTGAYYVYLRRKR